MMEHVIESYDAIRGLSEFTNVMREGREGVYATGYSVGALRAIYDYLCGHELDNYNVAEGHSYVVNPDNIKSNFIEFADRDAVLDYFVEEDERAFNFIHDIQTSKYMDVIEFMVGKDVQYVLVKDVSGI